MKLLWRWTKKIHFHALGRIFAIFRANPGPRHEKLYAYLFWTIDLRHFRLSPSLRSGYNSAKMPQITVQNTRANNYCWLCLRGICQSNYCWVTNEWRLWKKSYLNDLVEFVWVTNMWYQICWMKFLVMNQKIIILLWLWKEIFVVEAPICCNPKWKCLSWLKNVKKSVFLNVVVQNGPWMKLCFHLFGWMICSDVY